VNKSISFDGTTSYILLGDTLGNGPEIGNYDDFTFSTWVKYEASSHSRTIFGASSSASAGWQLYLNSSEQLIFRVRNLSTTAASVPLANYADKWTHITVSHRNSSNTSKIYINGYMHHQHTNHNLTANNTSVNSAIGAFSHDLAAANGSFKGKIADIKIWNSVLSDAQIGELVDPYNDPSSTGFPDPTHHYTMGNNSLDFYEDSNNPNYSSAGSYILKDHSNNYHTDEWGYEDLDFKQGITRDSNGVIICTGSSNATWFTPTGSKTNGRVYRIEVDVIEMAAGGAVRLAGGVAGSTWYVSGENPGKYITYTYANGANSTHFMYTHDGTSYVDAKIKFNIKEMPESWGGAVNMSNSDLSDDYPEVLPKQA
jgi:hypothetical protein